ncbi:putative DNA polymerase zeta catalytic subunit [Polychytrium aggregatum]|uniref:putative DNA polymerase zeta catalytic subunit n=1 Tax=Polychytrium aggregatum TaxID=110093 RepID=UPI0022FDDA86|nr:putative DNA polymerase zeta catalytic subunit [Polychytrium aggregatum]KAI9193679.1 putative DNA polymerase zeta catalytic subunit [Polychytrium aggregatum]
MHTKAPSIKIIAIDYYQSPPHPLTDRCQSQFSSRPLSSVPVVRIFGSVFPSEQRACLHVHQCFPYIYVPYEGDLNASKAEAYIRKLAASINGAMQIAVSKIANQRHHQSPAGEFVVGITLVQDQTHLLVDILASGGVMGKPLQAHESHINYIMQFFMDYNLYGMDYIHLKSCRFRSPLPQPARALGNATMASPYGLLEPSQFWTSASVPTDWIWPERYRISKQSFCDLELDATVMDILSEMRRPYNIAPEDIPASNETKFVPSLMRIWQDEVDRRIASSRSSKILTPPSQNTKRTPGTVWYNADELRLKFEAAIHQAREHQQVSDASYDDIIVSQVALSQVPLQDDGEASASSGEEVDEQTHLGVAGQELDPEIANDRMSVEYERVCASEDDDSDDDSDGQSDFRLNPPGSNTTETEGILDWLANNERSTGHQSPPTKLQPKRKLQTPSPLQQEVRGAMLASPGPSQSKKHRLACGPLETLDPALKTDELPPPTSLDSENDDDWAIESTCSTKLPSFFGRISDEALFALEPTTRFLASSVVPEAQRIESSPGMPKHTSDPPKLPPTTIDLETLGSSSTAERRHRHLGGKVLVFNKRPPSAEDLLSSLESLGLPRRIYNAPFFSRKSDSDNERTVLRSYGGIPIEHGPSHVGQLKEFHDQLPGAASCFNGLEYWRANKWIDYHHRDNSSSTRTWTIGKAPPTRRVVQEWLRNQAEVKALKAARKPSHKIYERTSTGSSEKYDLGGRAVSVQLGDSRYHVGLAAIQDHIDIAKTGVKGYAVHSVPSEKELIEFVIKIVRESDPDILLGFEIHMASWGYLAERAVIYHIDLCQELARVATLAKSKFGRDQDQWGFKKQSSLSSTGRIFLNVWRLFRAEVDLRSYTVEHLVYHTLRKRIPKMSNSALSEWYHHGPLKRWRTLRYYIDRAQYNLELLDAIELIGRTSEFARVFGIDFFSVLSRGSQFKVESILTRIIKPENYIMISPSRGQVARMRVYECIPLVMEPESGFYSSPVLVLDFQSLYPSVMIAYNYCEQYFAPPDVLSELQDHINISPNGLAFVKPYVREGALRKMLTEILETRVMVKESMKSYSDKSLLKLLEARQLGLKFIANVTYGYTGATYSGRMPCVEIADAIVQTGRVTLERAISLINKTKKWGAQVVYGDTDSLFVHLPGQTRERAFDIGKEICEAVTNSNPHPIKLKFEKVFHPCMLLTKKRYVGFKFESKSDTKPVFDAKGIETDLSALKSYLETEWSSILAGDVLIQDFIIAKEVKLGRYSENATLPAGAALSTRKMQRDHRSEPQYGERVPYLVAYGPGTRLVDLVIEPQELVSNRSLRLNGLYYITKQINPALSRIFNLVGADIQKWFADMPRVQRATEFTLSQMSRANSRITIDQYYSSKHCHVCGQISGSGLCVSCKQDPIKTAVVLQQRISDQTRAHLSHQRACRMCAGYEELDLQSGDAAPCISIDCKLYYGRKVAKNNMRLSQKLQRLLQEKK